MLQGLDLLFLEVNNLEESVVFIPSNLVLKLTALVLN